MLRHVFHLEHPAEQVLAAHRDGLMSFGPALPGVGGVELLERSGSDGLQRLSHRWRGDVSVLPGPLRHLVPADQFVWRDRSIWDERDRSGDWAIHVDIFGTAPLLRGSHRFLDVPGGCQVIVEGEVVLGIHPDTKLLGMRVGRWVGSMLEAAVQNLFERVVTTSEPVLARYLREHRRQAA